jgi:hypothetical protein
LVGYLSALFQTRGYVAADEVTILTEEVVAYSYFPAFSSRD